MGSWPTDRGNESGAHFRNLLIVLGLCVTYVLVTGSTLPDEVASHFNARGVADGSMRRGYHLAFLSGLMIVLPLLMATLPAWLARGSGAGLNIPHRTYWLAAERKLATANFLATHCSRFGIVLAIYLAFIHGQVVAANRTQPARLDMPWFWAGIGGFLVATAIWTAVLYVRFRKPR